MMLRSLHFARVRFYEAFSLAQATASINCKMCGFREVEEKGSASESEPPHNKFTKTILEISPFVHEVGGLRAEVGSREATGRCAVARRLRNLREPRRQQIDQQRPRLAAHAFPALGGSPVRERLAKGRPDTRFRVRGGGSGTREQREQSEEAHYAVCVSFLAGDFLVGHSECGCRSCSFAS